MGINYEGTALLSTLFRISFQKQPTVSKVNSGFRVLYLSLTQTTTAQISGLVREQWKGILGIAQPRFS